MNDTTHNSLRWIYRSAKIDWTKNRFEYVVLPPLQQPSFIFIEKVNVTNVNNFNMFQQNWQKFVQTYEKFE